MAVEIIQHVSSALEGNPLGDPHTRPLPVIVPDDVDSDQPLPCLWYLSGYGGLAANMLSHDPWQEGLEERLVRLRAEGRIGPMLVALPDCFTKYGGSQFISSAAQGDYETYLLDELRGAVESRWNVSGHGIFGKSSGGYGAIVHGMRRGDLFKAVACHSGDMGFRLAYTADLPKLMSQVRQYKGLEPFIDRFGEAMKKKKDWRWIAPMSVLAMAAAYSPNPNAPGGVDLPFDVETGQIDEAVFARWLAHDPVEMIDRPECQENLRKPELVFIDCGSRDEHHLQWGARGFVKKLNEYLVPHEYEEFDDGHRGTSYRFDVSLPKLYEALA